MSESRLILVDGSGYIFRAYYALPPMNNSKGIPTNAVYGFCNMMLRLIDEHPHDKILIILDAGKNTFRNTLYPEYKANRSEAPEDLIPQFGIIREAIDAFGLDVIEKKDFEADDIIASYVRYGEENKIPTTVFSSDKDLFQLLSTNTRIMDPMKNVEIDEAKVMDKFGVGPDKITDVQALIGDSVDNIPGVPGIGPKTASQLINEFNDIDGLIKNLDKIKQEKRRNILKESENDIRISLKLVTLKNDVKIPEGINKIKTYNELKNENNNIFEFLKEQGFRSISERLKSNSFISSNNDNIIQKKEIEPKYQLINSKKNFEKILSEIEKKGICAIDTETNSLNIEKAKLVGISICYSENISYYIPINHTTSDGSKKIDNQLEENYVINHINKICKNESILKIGQNIKYDIRILNKYGVTFNSIADTMLISYSIDNGIYKHNLDDLSFNHLNHTTIKYKEVVGTGKNEITFDKVTIDNAINYAAEDSFLTFRLFQNLYPRLIKEKANFVYQNIDLPLVEVLS